MPLMAKSGFVLSVPYLGSNCLELVEDAIRHAVLDALSVPYLGSNCLERCSS